jgi:hypothetical protein
VRCFRGSGWAALLELRFTEDPTPPGFETSEVEPSVEYRENEQYDYADHTDDRVVCPSGERYSSQDNNDQELNDPNLKGVGILSQKCSTFRTGKRAHCRLVPTRTLGEGSGK